MHVFISPGDTEKQQSNTRMYMYQGAQVRHDILQGHVDIPDSSLMRGLLEGDKTCIPHVREVGVNPDTGEPAFLVLQDASVFVFPDASQLCFGPGEFYYDSTPYEYEGQTDIIFRARNTEFDTAFYSFQRRMCIYRHNGWAHIQKNSDTDQYGLYALDRAGRSVPVGPSLHEWYQCPQPYSTQAYRIRRNMQTFLGRLLFQG